MSKSIKYEVSYSELVITDAEYALILALYKKAYSYEMDGIRITAIEYLRDQYTLSLKAAKSICDSIGQEYIV